MGLADNFGSALGMYPKSNCGENCLGGECSKCGLNSRNNLKNTAIVSSVSVINNEPQLQK